jgi:hypothetical protein
MPNLSRWRDTTGMRIVGAVGPTPAWGWDAPRVGTPARSTAIDLEIRHGGAMTATFTAFPGHAGRFWPLLGWRLVARTRKVIS